MIDPIFLLEAAVNGVLLGGVLALLALGLNLIFGVIDIVWIAYVDLVMVCMYLVYFLVMVYGWPLWLAGAIGTDDGHRFPGFDAKGDIPQGGEVSIPGGDTGEREHQASTIFSPRYASTTRGSSATSSGRPSAIFSP